MDVRWNEVASVGKTVRGGSDGVCLNDHYRKSANKVFYSDEEIEGAHADTLELISEWFARDRAGVYFKGQRLKGANPAEFELMNDYFGKDGRSVFLYDEVVEGADPASFTVLAEAIGKDINAVYGHGKKMPDVDPNSFSILSEYLYYAFYGRDDRALYHVKAGKLRKLKANLTTLEVLAEGWLKDDKSVWWAGMKVSTADPSTFQILSTHYARDKGQVYFKSFYSGLKIVEGADPETFIAMEGEYGRDANNRYNSGVVSLE